MTNNFTDRNKTKFDNDASEGGFRMIDMSDENGYGSANKDFSKGSGTYDSQSKSSDPINYDGTENFTEDRFSGDMGGQTRIQASSGRKKDSIETGGNNKEKASY